MIKQFLIFIIFSFLYAHDPLSINPEWTYYTRLGVVDASLESQGIATYGRLKRITGHMFMDVRFYGHFFKKDADFRIRQKTSRRFLKIPRLYTYNTLVYQRNTLVDVNLRYHYNQGLGWLIQKSKKGNITLEAGIAFDNSDYLNTSQKTSYLKTGFTLDKDLPNFSTKLEMDYYHQFSEIIENAELTRFQFVGEIQWHFRNNTSVICGFTHEYPIHQSFNFETASLFLTLAIKNLLPWKI